MARHSREKWFLGADKNVEAVCLSIDMMKMGVICVFAGGNVDFNEF